ncbi:MAG: ABC transporter permease [Clostridiales Family XIII bacterium]|jgi:ribose/xylose/arabinose/galactoside ABC-type transport system permease subunit|nr:ABC transporter permease [Clostridiales Family XIII bacterium]
MEIHGLNRKTVNNIFRKYMMEIILVVMFIVLSIFAPGFLSSDNILGIFRNMAIVGVIAFGMTMVIINGEIDLSVGSAIGISAVATAIISRRLAESGFSDAFALIIAMLAAVAICSLIGMFNGFIRARFGIPTFIITLAMLNVLYGIAATWSAGFPVVINSGWYSFIGAGQFFKTESFQGIPAPMIWLIIVFFIIWIVMNKTRFGREVYAVGGNIEAARLSGINIAKVKIITMMAVQALAAFSGIMLSSQVMAGSSQFGRGYEMDVIASVIIGGTSLFGGVGRAWGTFIGILFLGVINNCMTLLGVDDYIKYIVKGSLILIAVLINTIQLQRKDA